MFNPNGVESSRQQSYATLSGLIPICRSLPKVASLRIGNLGLNDLNPFGIHRPTRSAGFQTCCIADFQIGATLDFARHASLETCDTADLEVCATSVAIHFANRQVHGFKKKFINNGLQPGDSDGPTQKPFQRFFRRCQIRPPEKPLKRLATTPLFTTRLKPGVNEISLTFPVFGTTIDILW